MSLILKKLIKGIKIEDIDIKEELYEMCEREHSGCNDACYIYDMFCPEEYKNKKHWNCPYFKNPDKMLIDLRIKKNQL